MRFTFAHLPLLLPLMGGVEVTWVCRLSCVWQTHNGKEFDFVFEIEIEEGKKAKVGVNKDSNHYMVASDFLDEHELDQNYLETIVTWLDEQMERVCPKNVGPEKDLLDSDPFNDGKVYRAGSAGKNLNKQGSEARTYYDPLTGKRLGAGMGEDSESDDDKPVAKRQPPVTHIPSNTLHSFAGAPKADSLIKKLEELNAQIEGAFKLSAAEFEAVSHLCKALADADTAITDDKVDLVVNKMLSWPTDKILPALDIARALLMRPSVVCFPSLTSHSLSPAPPLAYAMSVRAGVG